MRPGCSRAAERGLNHVKGYIYKYDSSISENGPEYYFSETLPSVEEYQNKIDYYKSVFSSNVNGVVNGEISLYSPRYNGQDWVITQNPDDAKILGDMLKTILTDDGFSTVSVKVLVKPQTFVKIAKTWKPGSFMGRALRGKELTMTTRTTDKKE